MIRSRLRLLALTGAVVLGLSMAFPSASVQAATASTAQTMSATKVTRSGWHDKVMKVQEALNAQGLNPPLKVDGLYGKATRKAITEFQAGLRIKVTGKLDKATLEALKVG